VLLALGAAYQKYLGAIEEQQEILAGITDISMNAFAMESIVLRAQKLAATRRGEVAGDMCRVFVREAIEQIDQAARTVLAACSEGDSLRTNLMVLRRFVKFDPVDSIALRRRITARLLEAERYVV
jgi:butyryl-CoA dehydrogenase